MADTQQSGYVVQCKPYCGHVTCVMTKKSRRSHGIPSWDPMGSKALMGSKRGKKSGAGNIDITVTDRYVFEAIRCIVLIWILSIFRSTLCSPFKLWTRHTLSTTRSVWPSIVVIFVEATKASLHSSTSIDIHCYPFTAWSCLQRHRTCACFGGFVCLILFLSLFDKRRSPSNSSHQADETMGTHHEDGPSAQNFKTTGLMGIIIFTSILVMNLVAFRRRGKFSAFFLVFFTSLSLVCCFELPRYALLMYHGTYNSQVGYAFHIMASYLYFLCLTLIANLWSTFVELGPIEKKLYSKVSLCVFNLAFLVLVVTAIVFCVLCHSLDNFFDSKTFYLLTIVELAVGMIYSTCLGFLSVKLVIRWGVGSVAVSLSVAVSSLLRYECHRIHLVLTLGVDGSGVWT